MSNITARREDIDAILRSEHRDPFGVLGMHVITYNDQPAIAVRAAFVDVKESFVYVPDEDKLYPMTRVDDTGFFETVFPEVMPRNLTGGHTHLYTESSIEYFCSEFGFESMAEWWFGTDMVDLYRSILVILERSPSTRPLAESWAIRFKSLIDDIQSAMDKNRESSEVHMLVKVLT